MFDPFCGSGGLFSRLWLPSLCSTAMRELSSWYPEKPDVLNEEELKQLRHNLAHLSPDGVRSF